MEYTKEISLNCIRAFGIEIWDFQALSFVDCRFQELQVALKELPANLVSLNLSGCQISNETLK